MMNYSPPTLSEVEDVTLNSDSDGHRMEPIEIEDGRGASLPAAEELKVDVQAMPSKKPRRKWYIIGLACLAVVLLIAIVTPLSVRRGSSEQTSNSNVSPGKQDSSSSGGRQPAPREANLDKVIQFFIDESVSEESALRNNDSPQHQAAKWLAETDPANLPIPTSADEKYRLTVRYVMVVNFYALNGKRKLDLIARFMTGADICDWNARILVFGESRARPMGLFCEPNDPSDRIPKYLHFWGLGLTGELPKENGKLNRLIVFNMHTNRLTGNIPSFLCDISTLEDVSLGNNKFTGGLPSCFSSLPLEIVILRRNELTGSFPEVFCDMTSLVSLDISRNQFSGSLSTCLRRRTNLEDLVLHNNQFNGQLPSELCEMSALKWFDVERNNLEGNFPSCFANHPFQLLFLSDNMFEGELPALGDPNTTLALYVDDNKFSGNPLPVFGRLTALLNLIADGNEFTGDLDETFLTGNTALEVADLSHNNFTSTNGLPSSIFEHEKLQIIDISTNELSGRFPHTISRNTALRFFAAYGNELTGNLPSALSNLTSLFHFDVSRNMLGGPMISEIGDLTSLRLLFLSVNNFDAGPIPDSYANLRKLEELSVRGTNRTGGLPDFISQFPNIALLDMGDNDFTGAIPSEYGILPQLTFLLLNNNSLEGEVPQSFDGNKNLKAAYLDGNGVTGDVGFVCRLPNFADGQDKNEVVVADCDGSLPDVSCDCCTCCDASLGSGCSDPLLANLDASWENLFRRVDKDLFTFGGNRTEIDDIGAVVSDE